ncbi:MAG: hypothetical protein AUK63_1621 [bacterium P3]|nr:MAG: hypothetical protein AUK63_1621 [bacterium P3]KWW38999.1 MAG: hypothetical protein F083_1959 [bacterium F083]
MMKKYLLFFTLLAGLSTLRAQHQTSLYDSTLVLMEESGLSHAVRHERIRMDDAKGCRDNTTLRIDYDPLSAYVEFRQVIVHRHATGRVEVLIDKENDGTVYDYVAPARLIYWGASQKMVQVGHLDPGDELEYTTYRKGFTYALLGDREDDSRYIPPMRGHFYDIVPFWSKHPVQRRVYRLTLPRSKQLQYAVYNDPKGRVTVESEQHGDLMTYTFSSTDILPLALEPRTLANNDIEPKLLLSTAPDWQSKSVWFYGVNEDYGSFTPTAEVQAKVDELLRNAHTEQDSIAILTHWVADNIRYCGISMGEGEGYTLHNADMNFTDRCGVCKDKAGMLVTMLRAAGFNAYAAMTMAHERIDPIPADQFNHSVCAVQRRDGHFEMLDPTWVPNTRELWSSAEQQQGYLIGLPDGATLQYTPLSAPENHYIRIDATSKLDPAGTLSGTVTVTAEGQSDSRIRSIFNSAQSQWRNNLELELLRIAPQAEITAVEHTDPDSYLSQPVRITYRYRIPRYAVVDGNTAVFIPLSARKLFARAMPHLFFNTEAELRTQPFADACSRVVEIHEKVSLPAVYKQLHFPMVEGVADPAASFGCRYWMDGDTLLFDASVMLGKRVYEAHEWPMFRQVVQNQRLLATTPVILSK